MKEKCQKNDVKNFNIIFEKLAVAKVEQDLDLNEDLNQTLETTETILLFKEFQESFIQQSYSILTKG